MASPSIRVHDKLVRVQKPEKSIVKRYRVLCDGLMDLAQNSELDSTKVAAHRVIQEYIIKPLKQQYMEERKERAESKDSTPRSINVAVSNLPVGQQAIVGIKIEPQQPPASTTSKHNVSSRNLLVVDNALDTDKHIESNLSLDTLRGYGEAADKPLPIETTVYTPPHFLDIPNELSHTSLKTVAQLEEACIPGSSKARTAFESVSDCPSQNGGFWWDSLTSETRPQHSSGQPYETSCERTVKIFETAKDDRSPTIRRCPDCLAEWKRVEAAKIALGRICKRCKCDISSRSTLAEYCIRCAKANRNQSTVNWQRKRAEKAAERKKALDANL